MVIEPDVLLMDEPLSNLDTEMRMHLRTEIRALQRKIGVTTIYVTHDQEEALLMSDRIAVMRGGRLEQVASPHDIYNKPSTRFVASFIGENNFLPAVHRGNAEAGFVRIELPGGQFTAKLRGELPQGALEAAFRPQDIELRPLDGDGDGLVGTLTDIQFLGGTVRYAIDLGGGHLVQVAGASRTGVMLPEIGTRHRLGVSPAAIALFAPEAA
jgi:ABC-type Fe3+/spermidine/putrescine transport system ATPase subunit